MRLLRGEFGIRGVYIYVLILNEIYRERGYYKKWDFDDCCLMSDSSGVAGDCSPNLIAEIVQGCVRRSLFDKRVFDMFGVLTSAEIQRRFLKIVGNSRDNISIVQEYFLLDASNRKDVTGATSAKLTFFSIALKDSHQNLKDSTENLKDFPKEQNRKEQNRKEQNVERARARMDELRRLLIPSRDEVRAFARERCSKSDPDRFFDWYEAADWRDGNGELVRNWKQKFMTWERLDDGRNGTDRPESSRKSTERDFNIRYDNDP